MTMRGSCLCGSVTVTLPKDENGVNVCHCAMCRKWCSGPWMALQVPDAEISGDTLKVFKSSGFAERGFCEACGSNIFHRPQLGPELAVSAGLFGEEGLELASEIFSDRKPDFYDMTPAPIRKSSTRMALEWLPKLAWRVIARK